MNHKKTLQTHTWGERNFKKVLLTVLDNPIHYAKKGVTQLDGGD